MNFSRIAANQIRGQALVLRYAEEGEHEALRPSRRAMSNYLTAIASYFRPDWDANLKSRYLPHDWKLYQTSKAKK
jgi:hypothetical protein